MLLEQKRALFGMLIFGAALIAEIWLTIADNPGSPEPNRLLSSLRAYLLLFAFAFYGFMHWFTDPGKDAKTVARDERDTLVANYSLGWQLFGSFAALAIWAFTLDHVYPDDQGIPPRMMFIMVDSVIFASMLSRSVAILVGYRLPQRKLMGG